MKKKIFSFLFFYLSALLAQDQGLRIVPISLIPESESVILRLIFPRPFENKRKNPVNVQMRIEGFSLGVSTKDSRAEQIYNDPEGQSIHVIIDNGPYLSYYQSVEDFLDEDRKLYDKILSFGIPFNLQPGQHVIRAFPVRSYGESLKQDSCFTAETFYFQDRKKTDSLNIDLSKPFLTYNEPQGRFPACVSDPILLDFYLSNCKLSSDGYKVRLSIDNKVIKILTKWTPYYLYGLSRGVHRIQLELLDKSDQLVPGFFNFVYRDILIE